MYMNLKYNFIAIEGNIGAGKTTLSKKISQDLNAQLILESFEDNPFLKKFYNDPRSQALPLELFFMAERHQQLKKYSKSNLFTNTIVSDYFFVKSRLFAKNNLIEQELVLFNRLFEVMMSTVIKPDLIIYLHADTISLKKNIIKRGRKYEQNISQEYLKGIELVYLDYLKKEQKIPILLVDVSNIDFLNDNKAYNSLKNLLNESHSKGINYCTLSNPMTQAPSNKLL